MVIRKRIFFALVYFKFTQNDETENADVLAVLEDKPHTFIRVVVGAIKLSNILVYIGQTQENNVSAIMRVFFDNAYCVEFRSLENEYSMLWSTLTTLNFLKTIKRKTPTYKRFWQISRTL